MKLPSNVKIKTFPWTILPFFSTYTTHAIYPNIYVPKHIYQDLLSETPNTKSVSLLIHEQTHIQRQKQTGWVTWGIKYCFSKKFRAQEEFAAIGESMKYTKKQGRTWDIDQHAKLLSSYLYLWCTSYEEAKKELELRWKNA